jgi:hypothetical protein
MSLRQVWVRVRALPYGSPLHQSVDAAIEAAEREQQARDVDDVLAMMRKG